ncbi:hypothetical protein KY358_07035, partial [Candidatus Woesearchaeota archaeon]|nr:hypothetical protein [Candidatus Woesearchaeota archaeon]
MEESILVKAGLTLNESRIYMMLLQLGESPASDISKKANISRPHIYDSISRLQDKGLVSYIIRNNKKYFKAADPKELFSYLENRKRGIEDNEKSISAILPSLLKLKAARKKKPEIEVYAGRPGFKSVFNDILNTGKDFIAFGASGEFERTLPGFSSIFIKKRELKKIKARLVAVKGTYPVKTPLNEYRWIPKEFSSPSTTVVYGNKAAILLWLEEPLAIMIESKEVAESYKNYFELLWKIG